MHGHRRSSLRSFFKALVLVTGLMCPLGSLGAEAPQCAMPAKKSRDMSAFPRSAPGFSVLISISRPRNRNPTTRGALVVSRQAGSRAWLEVEGQKSEARAERKRKREKEKENSAAVRYCSCELCVFIGCLLVPQSPFPVSRITHRETVTCHRRRHRLNQYFQWAASQGF
jgi:hypothetical protein